jgi:hypothetical protein
MYYIAGVTNYTSFGSRTLPGNNRYSTLNFIKSKYRSVLADEHLTELVQTVLTTYQPNIKKLIANPKL